MTGTREQTSLAFKNDIFAARLPIGIVDQDNFHE